MADKKISVYIGHYTQLGTCSRPNGSRDYPLHTEVDAQRRFTTDRILLQDV